MSRGMVESMSSGALLIFEVKEGLLIAVCLWSGGIHSTRDSRRMSYETAAILNQNLPYISHIIG